MRVENLILPLPPFKLVRNTKLKTQETAFTCLPRLRLLRILGGSIGGLVNKEQVKARILEGIPDAEIVVNEFSGGNDHYAVLVVSPVFAGKKLLARHRLVLDLFQAEIATGEVHALTMKTHTPDEWAVEKPKQMMFT
ncbi:MAG: BolA family transcriptional regulator [Betaproteobacteria bacterium]|nr:BolA family transcriptional regulator [Betaproteobacteria bacterium]